MKTKLAVLILALTGLTAKSQVLSTDSLAQQLESQIFLLRDLNGKEVKANKKTLVPSIKTTWKNLYKKDDPVLLSSESYTVKQSSKEIIKDINSYVTHLTVKNNYTLNLSRGSADILTKRFVTMQTGTFEKLLSPIYYKVAGSNEDIAKNGKILSFDNNAEKSTISINHYHSPESNKNLIFNYGVSGKADESFLNIYNNGKYNYGFGLSAKVSVLKSAYLLLDRNSLEKLHNTRNTQCNYLMLAKYKELLKTDTNHLKKLINTLSSEITKTNFVTGKHHSFNFHKKLSDSLATLNDSLDMVKNFYSTYKQKLLDEEIEAKMNDFELKNLEAKGNSVNWIDFEGSYQLNNNSIFDSVVFKTLKISQKQFHKLNGAISINYLRNTKQKLIYINYGVKINNIYGLETKKLTDLNYIDTASFKDYSFRGYDVTNAKNINSSYVAIAPFINAVIFPGKKQEIGFEFGMSVSHQSIMANVFNGRLGVLYSVTSQKDKEKTVTTIGLFLSLNKFDSSLPHINESMSLGFRVGLPLDKLIR